MLAERHRGGGTGEEAAPQTSFAAARGLARCSGILLQVLLHFPSLSKVAARLLKAGKTESKELPGRW